MSKINLILFACFTSIYLSAQVSPAPTVITSNTQKVKFDDESTDHFMFNVTIDNLQDNGKDSFYNSNAFNPNFGAYFMYDLPLGKTGFSLAPGIGLTLSKVNLDNSILNQDTSGTTFVTARNHPLFATGSRLNYVSSSFYTSWLDIPVELRFKSKPINGRSCIKVAVGMRAGLNLAANSKITYYDQNLLREVDTKSSPFSDLTSFRYGATFRVGYGAINLFGYYGMNQLIKDNRNFNNLDLRQYSIGISLTGM
jgi:Outer membrane protein beta-barrel domain